jgi:hypothetical protein
MKCIKTDDEEVLDMLSTRSPQLKKAVGVLKELSADEQTRMLYEKREMARRDLESSLEAERMKWKGVVAEKDAALADKDAALADKDAALADKDAALAEQAAEIASLLAQMKKQNSDN